MRLAVWVSELRGLEAYRTRNCRGRVQISGHYWVLSTLCPFCPPWTECSIDPSDQSLSDPIRISERSLDLTDPSSNDSGRPHKSSVRKSPAEEVWYYRYLGDLPSCGKIYSSRIKYDTRNTVINVSISFCYSWCIVQLFYVLQGPIKY